MFTATNRTSRLAGLTFAVFMTVAVNGSMLMKFDSLAVPQALAQSAPSQTVIALESVTIVGQRT